MTSSNHPTLTTPEPLRGSEIGTFAHDSIVRRLPEIAHRTLVENEFPPPVVKSIHNLIEEIPAARVRPLEDPEAPDAAEWNAYVEPYVSMNWLQVPWFFAEFYFYRRILEATNYFRAGKEGYLQDPYFLQKDRGLRASYHAVHSLCALNNHAAQADKPSRESIVTMLNIDLWGNKADLSLWPVEEGETEIFDHEQDHEGRVIVDHSTNLAKYLSSLEPGAARVDLLLDNAGFELVADVCLADFLISTDIAGQVVLHPKTYPVFVSDALTKDVEETIAYLENRSPSSCGQVGKRLREAFKIGRLVYHQDIYWTSPLPLWGIPEGLRGYFEDANLVISKGDAHYRRLLGDRHWAFTTPFADIMSYFPAPIAALRTCKSEVMCGLAAGQRGEMNRTDPNWITNGHWGVIQYKP
jgi:uncharacterized protein with ATP-grasp and redox domains